MRLDFRAFAKIGLGLSLAALAVSPAQARNRYADNPAVKIDRAASPQYAPIGALEIDAGKDAEGYSLVRTGTGFYVSPCYVMTNAHVAFGSANPEPLPGMTYDIKFAIGPGGVPAFPFQAQTKLTVETWGRKDSVNYVKNDWALLKDKNCLGSEADIGWLEIATPTREEMTGMNIVVAGYASDHDFGQLSLGRGVATGSAPYWGLIMHSASMAPGTSGGPVLALIDNKVRVIGVNTSQKMDLNDRSRLHFPTYTDEFRNEFTSLFDILNTPSVKAKIDADKAGATNGNSSRLRNF